MHPRCGTLAVSMSLVAACGGSIDSPAQAPAPVASAAPSGSPDDSTATGIELSHARARQIGAAAGAWRRAHAGTCPTLKDVLDAYALPPGAGLDASGAPFTIACGDAEMRVFASNHEVADVQPYSAVVATVPNDPPPREGVMPASIPVQNADAVIRSGLIPRFRRCYNQTLKGNPDESGVLHGTIIVNGDGSVKAIVVNKKTTTLTDPGLVRCLTNAMKDARLPPSEDGRERRSEF